MLIRKPQVISGGGGGAGGGVRTSCTLPLDPPLGHTVNYLQRLNFNKIFEKNEKDNGSRADVVAQRKKIFSMMRGKEGSTTG